MPDVPRKNKGRYVEVPDALWDALGERAEKCGRSRVAELCIGLEWWLAQPLAATGPERKKQAKR